AVPASPGRGRRYGGTLRLRRRAALVFDGDVSRTAIRADLDQVRDLADLAAQGRRVLADHDVPRTAQPDRGERLLRGVLLADRALELADHQAAHAFTSSSTGLAVLRPMSTPRISVIWSAERSDLSAVIVAI